MATQRREGRRTIYLAARAYRDFASTVLVLLVLVVGVGVVLVEGALEPAGRGKTSGGGARFSTPRQDLLDGILHIGVGLCYVCSLVVLINAARLGRIVRPEVGDSWLVPALIFCPAAFPFVALYFYRVAYFWFRERGLHLRLLGPDLSALELRRFEDELDSPDPPKTPAH